MLALECRREELGDAAVAAIGKGWRRSIPIGGIDNGSVVAIAWLAPRHLDDAQVVPMDEDLCAARPAAVLRAGCHLVPSWYEGHRNCHREACGNGGGERVRGRWSMVSWLFED